MEGAPCESWGNEGRLDNDSASESWWNGGQSHDNWPRRRMEQGNRFNLIRKTPQLTSGSLDSRIEGIPMNSEES